MQLVVLGHLFLEVEEDVLVGGQLFDGKSAFLEEGVGR